MKSLREDLEISRESFADPSLAKKIINWEAKYDIKRMCEDAWRWQSQNPNGYI